MAKTKESRVTKAETEIDVLQSQQKLLLFEIKETNKKIDDKFDKVIEDFRSVILSHEQVERENMRELRSIYALKWVEKLMWVVLTALVGILLTIIFGGLSF